MGISSSCRSLTLIEACGLSVSVTIIYVYPIVEQCFYCARPNDRSDRLNKTESHHMARSTKYRNEPCLVPCPLCIILSLVLNLGPWALACPLTLVPCAFIICLSNHSIL